ncbi:ferredoxin [Sphingomonas sp.]|uniref:ferredoxin n=1 Tax=Sphingomonas sp. TaxID=28214 RepID=UPI003B00D40D
MTMSAQAAASTLPPARSVAALPPLAKLREECRRDRGTPARVARSGHDLVAGRAQRIAGPEPSASVPPMIPIRVRPLPVAAGPDGALPCRRLHASREALFLPRGERPCRQHPSAPHFSSFVRFAQGEPIVVRVGVVRVSGGVVRESWSMKVRVDGERCVGQGMCFLAAPEVFQLSDEDGHAYVSSEEVSPDLDEAVHQAQRSCPEQAIVVDATA